jgi:hypothetical protein
MNGEVFLLGIVIFSRNLPVNGVNHLPSRQAVFGGIPGLGAGWHG